VTVSILIFNHLYLNYLFENIAFYLNYFASLSKPLIPSYIYYSTLKEQCTQTISHHHVYYNSQQHTQCKEYPLLHISLYIYLEQFTLPYIVELSQTRLQSKVKQLPYR